MTHLCPEWNQIKDLPTHDLTTFLRSHDDELPWYLQLIRKRESKHEKQSNLFEKDNISLKKTNKKHEKMILDIDREIKKLTEIKNMLADENVGLRDKNGHLEQEIIPLHEILDSLEKENSKLRK